MRYRIIPSVRETITENSILELEANVIGLHNVGTATVVLDKAWTIVPGQKEFLGSQNDLNTVFWKVLVSFDTTTGTDQRLEIMYQNLEICE